MTIKINGEEHDIGEISKLFYTDILQFSGLHSAEDNPTVVCGDMVMERGDELETTDGMEFTVT